MTTELSPMEARSPVMIFGVGIALVTCLLGGALALVVLNPGAPLTDPTPDDQSGPVIVTGDPLQPMPEGTSVTDPTTDPSASTTAPELIGTTFAGDEVRITDDGRAKAIYFVAHWCSYCQEEIPVVQSLIDAGTVPDNLDLYAITTFHKDAEGSAQEWLAREQFSPATLRDDDDSSAMTGFGGPVVPYVVYLDAQHRVVGRSISNVPAETTIELWNLAASTATDE